MHATHDRPAATPRPSRRHVLQAGAATALTAALASVSSGAAGAPPWQPGPDEDGYDLWLRYREVSHRGRLQEYRRTIADVLVEGTDERLTAAGGELVRGLSGLLGRETPLTDVAARGTLVLGTATTSSRVREVFTGPELDALGPDGYAIRTTAEGIVVAGGDAAGALYGAFGLLRLIQTHQKVRRLDLLDHPATPIRMVDHWADLDRNVERGYAGLSIFRWDDLPDLDPRYTDYARALASLGLNASVVNSVNANPQFLASERLPGLAALTDALRPWGIRFYLSANYAAPMVLTRDDAEPITTADPLNEQVQAWWAAKVAEIYELIPDFGGFLVKANSEGQPGPLDYGRTHAEGANMLAAAVAPHGGLIFWRSFVHGGFDDWSEYQYDIFVPLDGDFADNVVVQTKNGPIDFQVREPVHPMLGAMPRTNQAIELQITQEYTGHEVHVCYLVPQWKEVLQFDTTGGDGPTVADIVTGAAYGQTNVGAVGVINFGTDRDWTGYQLGAANTHGFGRLAWNPALTAEELATEWITMTFGTDRRLVEALRGILLDSWETYEAYTSPLGMGYLTFPTGSHFDPDPISTQNQSHHTTGEGTGFDRTVASGTGYTGRYHEHWAAIYESLRTVPDELLLFMHWVPYVHRLHSGKTVIQHIYDSHFAGHERVLEMVETWGEVARYVDGVRHSDVAATFADHAFHARRWRDTMIAYFFSRSGLLDERREWLQYHHGTTPLLLGGWPNRLPVTIANATGSDVEVTLGLDAPEEWASGTTSAQVASAAEASAHLPVRPPLVADLLQVPVTVSPDHTLLGTAGQPVLVAPAGQRCHLALDGGSASSALTPGYSRLHPGSAWDAEIGFGWVSGTPESRDRGGSWDSLRRDFCGDTMPATLRIAIPAGRHRLWVLVGDGGPDVWPTHVDADGERVIEGRHFRGGTFEWTDGEIDGGAAGREVDLTFSSTPGRFWRLCALAIIDPDAEVPPVVMTTVVANDVMRGGVPNEVAVTLAGTDDADTDVTLELEVPQGWDAPPVSATVPGGDEVVVTAVVTPPLAPSMGTVTVRLAGTEDASSLDVVSVPETDQAALTLDAGSPTSPVIDGFERLSPDDAWATGRDFGWVGAPPTFRDRGRMDDLRRDIVLGRDEPYVLRVAMPPGTHTMHVLSGDAYSPSGTTSILENGVELGSSGPEIIDQGHFVWFSFELDGGTEGRTADLELVGSQRDGWWRVAAMVLLAG